MERTWQVGKNLPSPFPTQRESKMPTQELTIKQHDAWLYGYGDGENDLEWDPTYIEDDKWLTAYRRGYESGRQAAARNLQDEDEALKRGG